MVQSDDKYVGSIIVCRRCPIGELVRSGTTGDRDKTMVPMTLWNLAYNLPSEMFHVDPRVATASVFLTLLT